MIRFILNKISRSILSKQDNHYRKLFKSINKNRNTLTLFDVGGAGGLQNRWKLYENDIKTTFFEPDKRSYTSLKKIGLNVINKALWSKNTKKKFFLTKKSKSSSVFRHNKKYLDKFPDSQRYDIVNSKIINLCKLDEFSNKSNYPSFIKIDVQGAELEVLKGSKSTLKNVVGLEVEVNFKYIYHDIPLAKDIENFLNSQGFILNDYLTLFRWERTMHRGFGEIIHGDALFLRSPEKIIDMSSNLQDPIKLIENYVKILFIYNKLDLIKKINEFVSKEYRKILNLENLILVLEKNHFRIKFLDELSGYYTRYMISKDLEFPHWKL